MARIGVIIKERKNIANIHKELEKSIDELTEEIFDLLDKEIISEAKSNLQNNGSVDRGDLLASIKVLSVDKINHVHEIGSDSPHASFVEYGRGPVKASEGKTLHFVAKDTGEDVFVKSVGPAEARPFLAPAVISKTEEFQDLIVKKMQTRVNQITGL